MTVGLHTNKVHKSVSMQLKTYKIKKDVMAMFRVDMVADDTLSKAAPSMKKKR